MYERNERKRRWTVAKGEDTGVIDGPQRELSNAPDVVVAVVAP